MLEAYEPRKRFNESFAYGLPMVDGPWDFGLEPEPEFDSPWDRIITPASATPGGGFGMASELAATPGIVQRNTGGA